VHKFELKTRKTEKILEGIGSFDLSFNGEKMLYRQKDQWVIAPPEKPNGAPPKPGEGGPLNLASMEVYVDPPPNGSTCITRFGAMNATSFMIPACTA
jgi:hypothetical protein